MSYAAPHLARVPEPEPQTDRALEAVREALARLRFGAIALTVHDGNVVQIEVTEKRRFDA